jgi:hypothetical protein
MLSCGRTGTMQILENRSQPLYPSGLRRMFPSALGIRKAGNRILLFIGAAACFTTLFAAGRAPAQGFSGQPMATAERVRSTGWWPTKSTPRREEYVGSATCTECHSAEAAVQETTSMAKACARAADSRILQAHQRQSFHLGGYSYDLTLAEGKSTFSVSDGPNSVSAVLGWAFGEGVVGETYVFARGGNFYEARLSYFPALRALDITPGQSPSPPTDLEGAMGRRIRLVVSGLVPIFETNS